MTTKHRPIVADALKVEELEYSLVECCAVDDKCTIDDYSDLDILSEALYVFSKFQPGEGWIQYDDLMDDDPEVRKTAKRQLAQVKRFIKKWSPKVEGTPNPMGCSSPSESA